MATELLRNLAATAPADYFQYRGQDTRVLGQLVRRCVSTQQWSVLQKDETLQLYALFDLVLDQGLGSVIIDFLWEVCANPAMASSDPAEAYLMDWQCLRNLLQNDVDYCDCCQLQLCIKVLQELVAMRVDLHGGAGRHASLQEWRRSLDRRKDAAGPLPLFLSTLLSKLTNQGMKAMVYPPSSLSAALNTIFMYNPAALTISNRHARLALLLYLLLDLGMPATPSTFRKAFGVSPADFSCWQAAFLLDDSWAASSRHDADSLNEACCLLSGAAGSSTPLSFPEASAARGRPHDALLVLRASEHASLAAQGDSPFQDRSPPMQENGRPTDDMEQSVGTPRLLGLAGYGRRPRGPAQDRIAAASAGSSTPNCTKSAGGQHQGAERLRRVKLEVRVKLQAGLMQEALACAAACSQACSADDRPRWTHEIAAEMLQQATVAQTLGKVLQLPFGDQMQQAVVAWLEQELEDCRPAAAQLPLFYLQRGKLHQALQAYDKLKFSGLTLPEEQALQLDSLMVAATKIAPGTQRR